MALTLSTPNYTQFEKDFFITDAVIDLNTINNKIMHVASGVKNDQYNIPVLTSTPQLNPRTSIPTSYGSTALSNKTVTLGAFESYEEFLPQIFENHWHVDQISDRLMQRGLPSTFENYLGAYYTKKTFAPIETMIHMGSIGYTTSKGTIGSPGANWNYQYFDGIIRQAIVGSALQVASPSSITSANIIAKMESAKALMPIAIMGKADRYTRLKYIMGVLDYQKYEDALTNTTYKNNDTTEKGINKYKGYEIVVCAGIPEHTFYFCEATTDPTSNLHLAVTSLDNITFDINRLQNNSPLYFYKSQVKMGAAIAKFSEFVIHTTKIAGDFTA